MTRAALRELANALQGHAPGVVPADVWDRLSDEHRASQMAGASELDRFIVRNAHVLARGGRMALVERALREPIGSPVALEAARLVRDRVLDEPRIRASVNRQRRPDLRVRTFEAPSRMLWHVSCDDACRVCTAAGADGKIYFWETDVLGPYRLLPDTPRRVGAVAISPDGALIVASDDQGVVHVWDVPSVKLVKSFRTDCDGAISRVAFLDRRSVVVVGRGARWEVRLVPGGELVRGGQDENAMLTGECDGRPVIRTWMPGGVVLIDPTSARPLAVVPEADVAGAVIDQRAGYMLCSTRTDVLCYGWPSMRLSWRARAHCGGIVHLGILGERCGVSVGGEGGLRTWELESGEQLLFANVGSGVLSVARRGARLVTTSDHGNLHMWRLDSPELMGHPIGHAGSEQSLVAAAMADCAVTGGSDGTVCMWSSRSGRCEKTLKLHEDIVSAVVTRADASLIASAGWDGWLAVIPRDGGASVRVRAHDGWVRALCFYEPLDLAVSAGEDGKVRFWELSKARMVAEHETPEDPARSAAVGGGVAVVGYQSGRVTTWDLRALAVLWTRQLLDGAIRAVCFDPTGQRVAVEGTASLVIVNIAAGAGPEERHPRTRFVAWSPDGTCYVTTGEGGEVLQAYDVLHNRPVWSCAAPTGGRFSGEGCWIPASQRLAVVGHRCLHVLDGATGRIDATWYADGQVCSPVVSRRGDLVVCDPRGELTVLRIDERARRVRRTA